MALTTVAPRFKSRPDQEATRYKVPVRNSYLHLLFNKSITIDMTLNGKLRFVLFTLSHLLHISKILRKISIAQNIYLKYVKTPCYYSGQHSSS